MVKHKRAVISSLAVVAGVITYLGWELNKKMKKKRQKKRSNS